MPTKGIGLFDPNITSLLGDSYVPTGKLGTGSFAEVWQATNSRTKQKVAIKVVDLERLSRSNHSSEHKLMEHIKFEMTIMKSLVHPNIVKMFDYMV